MECVVNTTPRTLYLCKRKPVRTVHDGVWASRLVWTVRENLVSIWFQTPERLGPSESLYQVHYPVRLKLMYRILIE